MHTYRPQRTGRATSHHEAESSRCAPGASQARHQRQSRLGSRRCFAPRSGPGTAAPRPSSAGRDKASAHSLRLPSRARTPGGARAQAPSRTDPWSEGERVEQAAPDNGSYRPLISKSIDDRPVDGGPQSPRCRRACQLPSLGLPRGAQARAKGPRPLSTPAAQHRQVE